MRLIDLSLCYMVIEGVVSSSNKEYFIYSMSLAK